MRWHAGDVVRKLREDLRLGSQADLGRKAGVHKATVNKIEMGRDLDRVESETKAKIARALGTAWTDIEAQVPAAEFKLEAMLADSSGGPGGKGMPEDKRERLRHLIAALPADVVGDAYDHLLREWLPHRLTHQEKESTHRPG